MAYLLLFNKDQSKCTIMVLVEPLHNGAKKLRQL